MASSRKSSRNSAVPTLAARVASRLKSVVAPRNRLTVGLSGGVDSVVLLDCLQTASRELRFHLTALHVDHGLSPHAARWAAFCRKLCQARRIPFDGVAVRVAKGDGPEAAARKARYAVFARQRSDYVVLAHHRDDQVETLLLQLLRGAGVKGLAGMPLVRKATVSSPVTRHSSPAILRPLLDATRAEILEYAKRRKLKWVEDESNRDDRIRRNYLRHEVLPAIEQRFPAYRATLARSVGHLAETAALLDELAEADARGRLHEGALEVDALRRLPATRARNLLRWFFAEHGVAMPAADRLAEAMRQILGARRDARIAIELEGAELKRFADRVYVVRAPRALMTYEVRWQGEERLDLPGGGVLELTRSTGAGVSLARLGKGVVTIRFRRGGERLKPDCRRPGRSLKNLLQEARVAPWLRERLPLVFHEQHLVWAAGIGTDCAFQAGRGEASLRLNWLPPD